LRAEHAPLVFNHQAMNAAQTGMARPQVADGGTASNMEGSCEYIE
jgi:hypothetical protein